MELSLSVCVQFWTGVWVFVCVCVRVCVRVYAWASLFVSVHLREYISVNIIEHGRDWLETKDCMRKHAWLCSWELEHMQVDQSIYVKTFRVCTAMSRCVYASWRDCLFVSRCTSFCLTCIFKCFCECVWMGARIWVGTGMIVSGCDRTSRRLSEFFCSL